MPRTHLGHRQLLLLRRQPREEGNPRLGLFRWASGSLLATSSSSPITWQGRPAATRMILASTSPPARISTTRSHGTSTPKPVLEQGQAIYYCFTRTTPTAVRRVGGSSKNVNRRAGCGTWKSTGTRKLIEDCRGAVVGSKLHLSYYAHCCSTASNWIMHEFRLPDSSKGNDLILCRIKGNTKLPSPAPPGPITSACSPPPLPFLLPAPPPTTLIQYPLSAPSGDSTTFKWVPPPAPPFSVDQLLFCQDDDMQHNPPATAAPAQYPLSAPSPRTTTSPPHTSMPPWAQVLLCDDDDNCKEDTQCVTELMFELLGATVEHPPPEEDHYPQSQLGGTVCESKEDEDDPLRDFDAEIEATLLQDYNATTPTTVEQPPPEEDGNHCSLPLLSPQSQVYMEECLQDYNPFAATSVEQDDNHCSLPLPYDLWIGDGDITVEHFSWDKMDHMSFLEEEEQHQEEQRHIAAEPNSSSEHMKESGGGVDSSTSAILPDLDHVSGHLGPEEANASKRRRSLIKCASPSSRCLLPHAKRPRSCFMPDDLCN